MRSKSLTRCMVVCLAVLMLLAVASPKADAATCQASASSPIFPIPSTNLKVGDNGKTTVTMTNTSSTVPPPPNVAAIITGPVFFKLACADSNCNTPLPGTLSFVSCSNMDPNVTSCGLDPADLSGNTVKIEISAAGIPMAAGQALKQIADINWVVSEVLAGCQGTFFQRVTGTMATNDPACLPQGQVTGAAAGSSPLSAPTPCRDPLECEQSVTCVNNQCEVAYKPHTTICRTSAGICDVEESCTGSDPNCPIDGFANSTTICRPSAGICDVEESCTGGSAACPTDGFANFTTICRPSAGICDVEESCTGGSAACPTDGFAPSTTPCSPELCQSCTGSSVDCPTENLCPENLCLTRTPGFWCTHDRVTDLFLPVSSCGIMLNNTAVCTPGSAVEDLNFNANDARKANTSPQQLQLIRQCAAAALNFEATAAAGGDCSNVRIPCWNSMMKVWDYECDQTIADVYAQCCDNLANDSWCEKGACGNAISESKCIEMIDYFNNFDGDYDTLNCESVPPAPYPFCPSLGANGFRATPKDCSAAAGNGCANPGRSLGASKCK